MNAHPVVDAQQWIRARKELLAKEKEHTRASDALAAARRALPWVRVEKPYVFDGPQGEASLGDLFAGRSQLIVYHFMFAPDWEAGCKSCTFWADNFERIVPHLAARDATLIAVSRAPLAKLAAYARRLGFTFTWVSSGRTDFNADFDVSYDGRRDSPTYNYEPLTRKATDLPGISVFHRDEGGAIFHTYSTFGRGLEAVNAAYHALDLLPKGRDEASLPSPMEWVRRWDEYDAAR